jgi:4-amino-4-deoxy-L-arabinose transferase-like glycosyltransferase
VGIGLLILGCAARGPVLRSAAWLVLALVGQAVALQLVEAGTLVRWQHYKPVERLLSESHPLLLAYLALQAALVIVGLRNRWAVIKRWLVGNFMPWQLLGLGLVFVLTSAAVLRDVRQYVVELLIAAFIQAVNLGNVVVMAWSLPEATLVALRRRSDALFGRTDERAAHVAGVLDRFAVLAAIWVMVVAVILNVTSYERHPHITDEVNYLLHARFLAEGTLTLPAPPVPDAFELYIMESKGGLWYSATPPGWPAMLALGVRLGAPWLVNPLLAGVNVLLSYLLLRDLYDRRTARMAVFLLTVSPWNVFMAMNFMNHTFTVTCALAAGVLVTWARRSGHAWWAGLAGISLGIGSLIRPLDGLIVACLLGLWAIGFGGKRLNLASIVALLLGAIIAGATVLPYNALLTGQATVFPLNAYLDEHFGAGVNDFGFGANRGLNWPVDALPGHSPLEGLINADLNAFSINEELFGWSTGSLILVFLLLISGRLTRADYLMIALAGTVFCSYFFYWFNGGPDFGARYWFLMLPPCVVLTVRGVQLLESKVGGGAANPSTKEVAVNAAVLSLCALALVNYFPWRAIDKYYGYWGMRPDLAHLADEYGFGRSLILVRAQASHPGYASAAVHNPLDLTAAAPIYAWDRSPAVRAQLLQAYPDRPVWIVAEPATPDETYTVVAGPLSNSDLITRDNDPRAP